MRLIAEYGTAHDADIAALEYREKGILTHVSSRYSNGLRIITGAMSVGLWVVLEEQYEDAEALKKNGEHRPATALTEQEMIELEALTKLKLENTGSKILLALVYGIAVSFLLGYIFYVANDLLRR